MTKRRSHGELSGETYSEMLKRCGITRREAHEWIKLAETPRDEFEAVLALEDGKEMQRRIQAIKRAPVGGQGRTARPATRLLDALLALELQFSTLDVAALDDLDGQQRAALDRVASSLVASLQGLRCGRSS